MFIVLFISLVQAQNPQILLQVQEFVKTLDDILLQQPKEVKLRAENITVYVTNQTIQAYQKLSPQQQEYYNTVLLDMSQNFQSLTQDQVNQLKEDYVQFLRLKPEEQESFFALFAEKIKSQEQEKVNSQEFFTNIRTFIHEFITHPVVVENNWHIGNPYDGYQGIGKNIKLFDKFQAILEQQSAQTREKAHQAQNAVMYEVRQYYNNSNQTQQKYLKELAYNISQLQEDQIESIAQYYTEFLKLNQSQQETLLTLITPQIKNYTQSETELQTIIQNLQQFVKEYFSNPYVLSNSTWNLTNYHNNTQPQNHTNPQGNHSNHNHTNSVFRNLTDEQINKIICEEVVILEQMNYTTEQIRLNISTQIEQHIHNSTKRINAQQALNNILESHSKNKFHNKADSQFKHIIDTEVHNLEQQNLTLDQIQAQITKEIEEGIHNKDSQVLAKQLLIEKLQRPSGRTNYKIYYLYIGIPFAVLMTIGFFFLIRRHYKLKQLQNNRNQPYRVPDVEDQSTD